MRENHAVPQSYVRAQVEGIGNRIGDRLLGSDICAVGQCWLPGFQSSKKAVSWQTPGEYFGSMSLAQVSAEVSADDEWYWESQVRRAPIVGLGISDGAVVDGGITLWYADGNENTVSGVCAPDTGDGCLGVWKRTGERV